MSARQRAVRSAKDFAAKTDEYLNYCASAAKTQLPTTPGFLYHYKITRGEFKKLEEKYPREFDLMSSGFTHAAANYKIPNTASTLGYIKELNGANPADTALTPGGFYLSCEHDALNDGK